MNLSNKVTESFLTAFYHKEWLWRFAGYEH